MLAFGTGSKSKAAESRVESRKDTENLSRKPLNCKMVTSNATMVKGVQKALENINSVLGPKIIGLDSRDEGKLTDCSLSGTGPITTNLRANAIFGVSLTLARALAHTANSLLYRTLADGRKPVNAPAS